MVQTDEKLTVLNCKECSGKLRNLGPRELGHVYNEWVWQMLVAHQRRGQAGDFMAMGRLEGIHHTLHRAGEDEAVVVGRFVYFLDEYLQKPTVQNLSIVTQAVVHSIFASDPIYSGVHGFYEIAKLEERVPE